MMVGGLFSMVMATVAFAAPGGASAPTAIGSVFYSPGAEELSLVEAGDVIPMDGVLAARIVENARGRMSAEVTRPFGPIRRIQEDARAFRYIAWSADERLTPEEPLAIIVDEDGEPAAWLVSNQRGATGLIVELGEGERHFRALTGEYTETVFGPEEHVVAVISADPKGGLRATYDGMSPEDVIPTIELLNPNLGEP